MAISPNAQIDDRGNLTLRVDYESLSADQQTNGIPMTIQVAGSEPVQRESIDLVITVTNVDDEQPTFSEHGGYPGSFNADPSPSYRFALDSGAAEEFWLIIATDDGPETIAYAITADPATPLAVANAVSIGPSGLITYTGGAPRILVAATYDFTITATAGAADSGGESTASLTITVNPIGSFSISADADDSTPGNQPPDSIPERESGERITLTTLRSNVEDAIVYEITGSSADPHPFAIEGNTLILSADGALDYEDIANYTLTITGTSPTLATDAIDINIAVSNLDDEAPAFDTNTILTGVTVEAGTTALSKSIDIDATDDFTTAAHAGDPEAEISYALVDIDGSGNPVAPNAANLSILGDFSIHAQTGVIAVASAPTFSATAADNERTLTIRATDSSLSATGATIADGSDHNCRYATKRAERHRRSIDSAANSGTR